MKPYINMDVDINYLKFLIKELQGVVEHMEKHLNES